MMQAFQYPGHLVSRQVQPVPKSFSEVARWVEFGECCSISSETQKGSAVFWVSCFLVCSRLFKDGSLFFYHYFQSWGQLVQND